MISKEAKAVVVHFEPELLALIDATVVEGSAHGRREVIIPILQAHFAKAAKPKPIKRQALQS